MDVVTVTLNTSVDRTLDVPGFAIGGHLKGRLARLQAAGKGVNVARCLATLGVPSVVTGFVGMRELALFRESLADTVAAVALVPVADATRTCTTILDPELGTETHIREAGFRVSPAELEALRERLGSLASPDALVVFCGSLPPGLEPAHVVGLVDVCLERGARVAADLNGAQLRAVVDRGAWLVKPNVEELGELLGRDLAAAIEAELLAAARSVCDRVQTVVLTRGRQGTLAVGPSWAIACTVDIAAARNTVGCGDAFLAGYLAGVWEDAPREECLRRATACGAASALTEAAGQIDAGTVHQLAQRARLRTVTEHDVP